MWFSMIDPRFPASDALLFASAHTTLHKVIEYYLKRLGAQVNLKYTKCNK